MEATALEKKWFVYLSDHHEGPFSLNEIKDKISMGLITPANYVWKEGMTEWRVITELTEFESILGKDQIKSFDHTRPQLRLPNAALKEQTGPHTVVLGRRTQKSGRFFKIFAWTCTSLLILGAVLFYFSGLGDSTVTSLGRDLERTAQQWGQKIPLLNRWISPIPTLSDVSETELQDLRSAALHDPRIPGPALAIALSTQNPTAPELYVASNLVDGSQITLYLEGIPDTLIQTNSFFIQQNITLTNKLGKSIPIRAPTGKSIPQGQYQVYATDGMSQPEETQQLLNSLAPVGVKASPRIPKNIKLFALKTYFLGGKDDTAYKQKLREYHEKIKKQATQELQELKQFISTLEAQLGKITSEQERLMKLKNSSQRKKVWQKYSKSWLKFSEGLSKTVSEFSGEKAKNSFFYSMIYEKIPLVNEKIIKAFDTQKALIEHTRRSKALEVKLEESLSSANNAISEIKAKITKAENLSPSPTGMPQKDGL